MDVFLKAMNMGWAATGGRDGWAKRICAVRYPSGLPKACSHGLVTAPQF